MLPTPALDAKPIAPPCISVSFREMKRPRPEPPKIRQQVVQSPSRFIITIVDMCARRRLRKACEKELVFFVAQATTRVLHGEDDVDLFALVEDLRHRLQQQLTISPFSQSACRVAASDVSELRENGTLKLWVGCFRETPRLTLISRISSSRVNLIALVIRFLLVSRSTSICLTYLR